MRLELSLWGGSCPYGAGAAYMGLELSLWGGGCPYGAGAVPMGRGLPVWGWSCPYGAGAVPMGPLPHGFPPQDFGYVQTTATEVLRSATHGEPETTKAFSLLDLRSVGLVRGSDPAATPP